MQYDEQEKTKSASPASTPNESTKMVRKTATPATYATQQPAWTQAMGNQPPASLQAKLTVNQPGDIYEQEADRVAEQVMRMPTNASSPTQVQGETIMRKGASSEAGSNQSVPPIVHQALSSSGQLLDSNTRAMMEPRFGQDFSGVRVHTDGQAAESAQAVNARAYTVGNDVVFGEEEYQPGTGEGQRLLAHELTHVVQQQNVVQQARMPNLIQRQPKDNNALDDKARAIIQAAKDTTKSIDQRAIEAVKSIVKTYYDSSMVAEVVYDEGDPGLTTSPVGQGKDIKGKIAVGKYFVEHIDSFARRVLQVGHELQHVEQQRAGMGGGGKRHEREFLAHAWTAQQQEKQGTGRVLHAMRRDMIDEALKHYNCFNTDDQKRYETKKKELLKQRETENSAGGNTPTEPPMECAK